MLPTNDYIFRRLFGHVGNEKITAGLIGSIINQEIKTIKINENPITEKDLKEDKVGVLDLKVRLNDEIVCDVEMQVVQQDDIDKRLMFYWGKMYTAEIKEKQKYEVLPRTIVILIANFELDRLKKIPKYHTEWQIREKEYGRIVLTDTLEFHIMELPKLVKQLEEDKINKKDKVALWLMFLLNPENVGDEVMEENEDLKLAKEELEKLKQDEHAQYMAELRMKHIMDSKAIEKFGFRRGLEQGEKNKQLEIAKKLISLKMPTEQIIEITGLTEEEIKSIQ